MSNRIRLARMILFSSIIAFAGCGQDDSALQSDASEETPAPVVTADVTVTPEMEELLAKADALDGKSDKTIERCASCLLGMDGSPDIALVVGDYTMYFCRGSCRDRFCKDVTASVLAMKPDEAKKH